MRILSAHLEVVNLSLRVPFRTALRSTNHVTDIRVSLVTHEGIVGFGSASPTPAITGETTESIISGIHNFIFPSIRDVDLEDRETTSKRISSALVHNRSAKAAVDIALHDLYAKQQGISLSAYLGLGNQSSSIKTDATVSLATVEEMSKQAVELAENGFSILKVKLGGRDGLDVKRIWHVRQSVGPGITIRVDANQAWTAIETLRYVEQMETYGIEFIEQPVPAHDVKGLAEITRHSQISIAADESVYDGHDLTRVIDQQAAHIVNIKLMKSGGIYEAEHMIQQIREAGMDFMIGSMMEGPASVAAAAHLAAAHSCRNVDLDAAYFLAELKATGGITYDASIITLPVQPGLGVELITETGR